MNAEEKLARHIYEEAEAKTGGLPTVKMFENPDLKIIADRWRLIARSAIQYNVDLNSLKPAREPKTTTVRIDGPPASGKSYLMQHIRLALIQQEFEQVRTTSRSQDVEAYKFKKDGTHHTYEVNIHIYN